MASTFTAVDLSRTSPPPVIEALSYEAIYAEMLARLIELVPGFDATVESDPAVKVLQVAAYHVLLCRQRVNDAAQAVMVAFAEGADLDRLGALFGTTRFLLTPADAVTGAAAVYETDAEYRRRIVLAPEGYSVAGPQGAYIFHALSAHPDVLDASCTSPAPGEVLVTILSRVGRGVPAAPVIAAVTAYLSDDTRRPLTDHVTVQAAVVTDYNVVASITTFAGPDASLVLAAARRKLDAYIADCHRLGRDVTRSGLFAALHVEGVQNVTLTSPATTIAMDAGQAAWCASVEITHAGTGE